MPCRQRRFRFCFHRRQMCRYFDGSDPSGRSDHGYPPGDLDPAVIQYICNKENKTVDEVLNTLNKKSGLLGMSGGLSSDCRDITAAAEEGHHLAKVTPDAYTYRIAKYVGAYAAAMNGVDAIAFTAGVGENDIEIREELCENTGVTSVLRSTKKQTTPEARTSSSLLLIPRSKFWLSQPTKSLQSQEIPWLSSKFLLTQTPLSVWTAGF